MSIEREQALAFRVAGQNLHERTDPLTAVAACGLQEAPPGWSPVALRARAEGSLDPDQVVLVNAMRGSPHLVPVRDVRVFTEALVPDDAGLKVLVGSDDELQQVQLEGHRSFVLAADHARLEDPPTAHGVRLLGGYDAYVGQPDRETLVPDTALRRRMYPAVARPGVVLRDGVLAGLWKGRKRKDVLDVELEWLAEPADVEGELQVVACLRGCESARVQG